MRLSRPRVILRAVLLLVLAAFMAWRARDTGRTAAQAGLEPGDAVLLGRIALLEWVLAGLALITGGAALLTLRQRPRTHSLHLGAPPPPGGGPPPDAP